MDWMGREEEEGPSLDRKQDSEGIEFASVVRLDCLASYLE